MNTALILEEYIRDRHDIQAPTYLAFLDAKSAFDVVSHKSLMRKLFNIGVDENMWTIINSLYQDTRSAVKWRGEISKHFRVEQGVRQGGILRTDFYKVYNDGLLDRLQKQKKRHKNWTCHLCACADDTVVGADCSEVLQSLLDIGVDYSKMERYIPQPVKSVVIEILNRLRRSSEKSSNSWDLDDDNMSTMDKTMHVGICRSADTDKTAVADNVKKARRTLYSLMSAGLHGENGRDPKTSLSLYQIYAPPILLYGIEVVFPRPKFMEVLDKFNKHDLKHMFPLPVTAVDPAINILSGTLPI